MLQGVFSVENNLLYLFIEINKYNKLFSKKVFGGKPFQTELLNKKRPKVNVTFSLFFVFV
ncbi:hypothetical protein bcgnr5402_55630 [Bacillus cereus]